MIIVTIVLAVLAAVLLLPSLSDAISLLRGAFGSRTPRPAREVGHPRLLVLVPAHDEEMLLAGTLRSLAAMRYPAERLDVVVVADNCVDSTATIARNEGSRCLERQDSIHLGKPWAIDWALKRLPVSDYDAIVIVDADSIVDRDFASGLASVAPLAQKAVQPYNDVSNRSENRITRMAAVFSASRFLYMNVLKSFVALNVPLGNGLCIGSGVLARHGWTAFSICEDWEMYASLTYLGERIENVPAARIYSQEARSLNQSSSQRRRWTAGRMTVLGQYLLPVLRARRVGLHQKLDLLAEFIQQGPAVHFGVAAIFAALSSVLPVPGSRALMWAFLASLLRPIGYTLAALRHDPEPAKAMLAFTYLPFYTVWRLGIQLASFGMLGNKPWVRTERHVQR